MGVFGEVDMKWEPGAGVGVHKDTEPSETDTTMAPEVQVADTDDMSEMVAIPVTQTWEEVRAHLPA